MASLKEVIATVSLESRLFFVLGISGDSYIKCEMSLMLPGISDE